MLLAPPRFLFRLLAGYSISTGSLFVSQFRSLLSSKSAPCIETKFLPRGVLSVLLVSCHSCRIELSTPAVFFSSMPSAARNIVIEVCSFSSPVVSLGFLLLLVAAAPVRLLLSEHPLRFLLPPFASSRFAFRVLVVSSVALVTLAFRLVSVYSMSLPACVRDYCVTAPCSTFRHLRDLFLPRPRYPLRTFASSPRLSGPCPLLSSRALALAPCLFNMPSSFVCVPVVLLPSSIALLAIPFLRFAPAAAAAFLVSLPPMSELP